MAQISRQSRSIWRFLTDPEIGSRAGCFVFSLEPVTGFFDGRPDLLHIQVIARDMYLTRNMIGKHLLYPANGSDTALHMRFAIFTGHSLYYKQVC